MRNELDDVGLQVSLVSQGTQRDSRTMLRSVTYMIKLSKKVGFAPNPISPRSGLGGAVFVNDIHEINNLGNDLLASLQMVRQAHVALAAGTEDHLRDLKVILELLCWSERQ